LNEISFREELPRSWAEVFLVEVEKRLKELGIELQTPPKAVGTYTGAKKAGAFVYTAGQLPGADFKRGKIGKDLSLEEGYEAARRCAINCLAQLKSVVGNLDQVESVVRVTGYINSAEGFAQQPAILAAAGYPKWFHRAFDQSVWRRSGETHKNNGSHLR